MSGGPVLRLSPDVSFAELHGEAVVLHLRDGKYFSANGTGTGLLRLLRTGATRASLVERLATEYRLAPERAAADVDRWLAELSRHGLVAEVEDPA